MHEASKKKAAAAVVLISVAALAAWAFHAWDEGRAVPPSVAWGSVDARTVDLSFEAAGRIAELMREEGERVKAGELIGRLDTTALSIERERAAAQLEGLDAQWRLAQDGFRTEEIAAARALAAAARSELELAKLTRQRTERLHKIKAASDQQLDEARAAERTRERAVAAADANLAKYEAGLRPDEVRAKKAARDAGAAALKALDYQIGTASILTAPADGVIRSRLLEPGDMASSAKRVYQLAVTNPKWVHAYVTETQLAFVREGAAALVTTDTTPPMRATVGFISPEAEFTPKTVQTQDLRTVLVYEVRLNVEDPENALRLGQPVTVDFAPAGAAAAPEGAR